MLIEIHICYYIILNILYEGVLHCHNFTFHIKLTTKYYFDSCFNIKGAIQNWQFFHKCTTDIYIFIPTTKKGVQANILGSKEGPLPCYATFIVKYKKCYCEIQEIFYMYTSKLRLLGVHERNISNFII